MPRLQKDAPQEFVDLVREWMVKHGPDGHSDGHEIIAQNSWDWVRNNWLAYRE